MLQEQPYLSGREFGLADAAYVPWIVRARDRLDFDLGSFTALSDWLERLTTRPSIVAEIDLVATT